MNKTLKIILIIFGIIVLLFLISVLLGLFTYSWANHTIPSGNSKICAENICKEVNADNSFYNESATLCICYKQGQIIKQTRIFYQ